MDMAEITKITTDTVDTAGMGKQFLSVFTVNGKNFYASTCFTFDAGYESMVFTTEQEPPENPSDIDPGCVSSWSDLSVRHYGSRPSMEDHLQFIKNFALRS